MIGWFKSHNCYRRSLGSGKHAVACPWDGEHSVRDTEQSSATVVWEAAGTQWPTFFCSHNHCEARRIADVMALWGDADRYCARAFRGSA